MGGDGEASDHGSDAPRVEEGRVSHRDALHGRIGGDVPDDLCYQWAVEYFNDMNAEEDKTKDDEEFVPKAYRSTTPTRTKKKETKKKEPPKKVEPAPKPADTVNQMQLTFESAQQSFLEGVA